MSYKTDRLVDLLPGAYGAGDRTSALYKLLDAVGAELMEADARLKDLLKAHWVRYASGAALDGLGAVFDVRRRVLRTGVPEADEAFRRRLQGMVPLFTGGGTVEAVKGAVRSALGLPFDLAELGIPDMFAALRRDIDSLIQLREFSPQFDRVVGESVAAGEGVSEAVLVFDLPSVGTTYSQFEWTTTLGVARRLALVRIDTATGVRSIDAFRLAPGEPLRLNADADGRLSASIGTVDVSASFVNLDGSRPARLPEIPEVRSEWRLTASAGAFDQGAFERDTFDAPRFRVEQSRIRLQPLTFEVEVPFFLQDAVAALKTLHGYSGELLVYESLGPDDIQQVIEETRAAGVRGSIRFSLNFYDLHSVAEGFTAGAAHRVTENQDATESLVASNITQAAESQAAADFFAVGGVFDIGVFDGVYGFN
jgi:hypothetical protein